MCLLKNTSTANKSAHCINSGVKIRYKIKIVLEELP